METGNKTTSIATKDAPAVPADKAKKVNAPASPSEPMYQFRMMEAIGVPRSEIKKFADPVYWTKYFPPIAKVLPIFG
jgi:leucyl-tRNA synthetase